MCDFIIILIALFCSNFIYFLNDLCMYSTITEHSIADEIILYKVFMVYNGRTFVNLFSIPTLHAILWDKLLIWIVQLKCSSMCTPRNVVNLICSIL